MSLDEVMGRVGPIVEAVRTRGDAALRVRILRSVRRLMRLHASFAFHVPPLAIVPRNAGLVQELTKKFDKAELDAVVVDMAKLGAHPLEYCDI